MLVIQPIGGKDDWEALFHEAGHTEHYAHTNGDLTMEAKRLGDMAVTEGWAMLMQHLVTEPAWLNRRLDVPRPADLAYDGAVSLLYFVRRYCAKLLYEIEFFQADDLLSMRGRYHEILSDALKLPVNPESYLDDIDGSFYVIGYLRSWAFEAQLREFLRGEFGNEWFAQAGCRRPAARALVARAGPDGRRAAQGRHGREARDGCRRRSGARGSRRLTLAPDDQLIVSMARGAEDALAELYDRFGGVAYGVALRILRDPALAQDAVQDAFLAAWRTAAAFDPARGNASTWLLTLVHRRAVDLVRREERRRADVLDESAPVASGDSTDEAAEVRAQRRAVQAALAQLPADQREALELAYYGGLSQSQLAERLGIPLGTVKSRMFTALATLRDLLGSQEP